MRRGVPAVHPVRSAGIAANIPPNQALPGQLDKSLRSSIFRMEASVAVGEPEAGQQVGHLPGLVVIGTVDEAEIVVQRL